MTTQETKVRHAISFDVEDWYQGFILRGIKGWEQYDSREESNVKKILKILDEFNTKATFFVLGKLAEKQPEIVRLIDAKGHEVATHGYAHKLVPEQSPQSFREDLHRSIAVLEEITSKKVTGHRATRWSIVSDCLWTLDILAEEGIEYDSSIFPTRFHPHGIANIPLHPYQIKLPSGNTIYEFPAQVFSLGPFRLPAAGGFYFRALPGKISEWALNQSEKKGHSGMVYLHSFDLDANVPVLKTKITFRIIRYYHLSKTEGYLRRLLERFRFCSVREIVTSLNELSEKSLGT